mgnify:CR=1 FL=1
MVKDNGTEEIISGKNRYFLHYKNYGILDDPVQKNNFLVSFNIPVKELIYEKPGIKQVVPIHPNCNVVDVDKKVHEDIGKAIKQEFGEIGTFHLKTQSVKIICKDLEVSDTTQRVSFTIDDTLHQGIVDGANLYLAINSLKLEEISKHSYVKVDFYVMKDTSISDDMVKTLDAKLTIDKEINITKKELHWLEEIIQETDYAGKMDAVDVLCLINLFRNNYYDAEVSNQPIESYWNKQRIKELYKENPNSFIQYKTIVKDILYLYDYVNWKTQELWPSKKGSLNSLGLTTKYNQKAYEFYILDKKLDYKLHDAVIFILLNGFRPFVIFNQDTTARWSKDFGKILELYDTILIEIISIIKDYSGQMGHNPHLLGKNKMLYSIIYKEFMMGDLLNQFL